MRRLPSPRRLDSDTGERRDAGIALMVVMVLFTVLIVVVGQLQFTTKMEEELAEVRATQSLGSFAISAIAAHIMTLLADDYRDSKAAAGEAAGGAGAMGAAPAGPGAVLGGNGAPQGGDPTSQVAQTVGPAAMGGAGGGAGSKDPGTHDYVLKQIFKPDSSQSFNGVKIKFTIRDNESKIDLNQIWNYPHIQTDNILEEQEEQENQEARENADADEDPDQPGGGQPADAAGLQDALGLLDEIQDGPLNSSPSAFVEPTEEQREAVREMIARALDMMIALNEERGFYYQFEPPDSTLIATAIEDYCYYRRSQADSQSEQGGTLNRVNFVSELLNIEGMPPELFYGPRVEIPPGEELYDPEQFFSYTKDEFGDLNGEALYASEEWLWQQEDRMREFGELMSMADAPYQSFAGLGNLGNPMTRGMGEYAEDMDGLGLLVPPVPLSMRDIFCTHSTGKININTAPPPVIFGLLLSLDDIDAGKVARDLEEYRYLYQEEMSEEEAGGEGEVEGATGPPDDRPKREPPPEEGDELLDDEEMLTGTAGIENPETNYFTNLNQLVWIDGEEGDENDLLNDAQGIERVDEDFKTPFQLARDDLQGVVVYGSTYFSANVKYRAEKSPVVKEGELLFFRDHENRRIELIHWQEFER